MTTTATLDAYGVLTEPATLTIHRVLPGPAERVWDYLTKSELRRQWLASGDMEPKVGSTFELTWRNASLDTSATPPPEGFPADHSMEAKITAYDPPRKLAYTWGTTGGVEFNLETQGDKVLLTLVHHRLPSRDVLLNVSAGWHAHLDSLVLRMADKPVTAFGARWTKLKADYEQRF